jgi:hypothetical protein
MKIDIENYENLTPEEKIAALEANFTSVAQIKATADKNASEAAAYKKQLREKQTDEEAKAAKAAEEHEALLKRLEQLEHEKAVGTYTTAYVAMGYDEKLAAATAEAMAKGDTETVLKNQKIHLETREKALRTELLKQTPPPAGGGSDTAMTKEKLRAMSPQERYQFSVNNPEEYKNIYGGN